MPDQEEQLDEFLGALDTLGCSAGNGSVRKLLGWEETTYGDVKAALAEKGTPEDGNLRWYRHQIDDHPKTWFAVQMRLIATDGDY